MAENNFNLSRITIGNYLFEISCYKRLHYSFWNALHVLSSFWATIKTFSHYDQLPYNLFLFLYISLLTHPTFPYLQLHVWIDTCSWYDILALNFILSYSVISLTRGLDPSPCLCLFPPVSALPCLFLHPTGLQDVLYPQIEFWTFFCKHNTCTDMLKL